MEELWRDPCSYLDLIMELTVGQSLSFWSSKVDLRVIDYASDILLFDCSILHGHFVMECSARVEGGFKRRLSLKYFHCKN